MGDTTREFQAIVWIKGSVKPPERLTVQASDEAEATKLIVERFGEQIVSYGVWNEEDARKRWPRPAADQIREYKAIVWPKDDPMKAGQRVTLQACGLAEATKLLEEMFPGTEIVYSLWNEEDANRTR